MAETITITDNRTNQSVEIPIENKSVASTEWMRLLPGIWFYDPGLPTTAATSSAICAPKPGTQLRGELSDHDVRTRWRQQL